MHRIWQRTWIHAWLLLSPAFVFLLAFTHIPAVTTLWNSLFTTPRGRRPSRWAGLENYETLIADPIFWKVLSNKIWFALGTIPTSIAIALAMALWVNEKLAGRGFLRMAYFTPTVLPMIAVANIWMFFYTPGFGLIDQITGLFGLPQSNILGQPDTALWGVMAVTIWKEAGFFMIFYLAALQTIPPSLIEAARIEGAGPWTIFRRVTFPLLMPTTLFVSINAVVNSFRMVEPHFHPDRWRTGQCLLAAAVLHLRGRLPVLGHRLCRHADRDPAYFPWPSRHWPVLLL